MRGIGGESGVGKVYRVVRWSGFWGGGEVGGKGYEIMGRGFEVRCG